MKTSVTVTLSGMNSSIGNLTIVLPQRSVRRERHLSQKHKDAISRGMHRHHNPMPLDILNPEWWSLQPFGFCREVNAAMNEGQALRRQRQFIAAAILGL